MVDINRRSSLKLLGAGALMSGVTTGSASGESETRKSNPRGTLTKLGQIWPEDPPRYNDCAVREDGMYAVVSSFPRGGNNYASTLYDLSDLENPKEVHRLPPANLDTRSNSCTFDAVHQGIYYRSQEQDTENGEMGVEVIDYGYADGTPQEPEIIAQVTTPNVGVHQMDFHPEEPILYVTAGGDNGEPGVISIDMSDPSNPSIVNQVGPIGACHAMQVDPGRNVIHTAYIHGEFIGYAILDMGDTPLKPTVSGRFNYKDLPDYEEIGTPGFESCHAAHFDPERDLAIIGDEKCSGIPGGKHIFDIGWDKGSLEKPVHIGFTHSPNAKIQTSGEGCFWTTHFHDVIPKSKTDSGATLVVDGGYHEGAWLIDITDPRNPQPAEQYPTLDKDPERRLGGYRPSHPPYCWTAKYNPERDFVLGSDTKTGLYTFDVSDDRFKPRSIPEELTGTDEELDDRLEPDEVELAVHYYLKHASVPNTNGKEMTSEHVKKLIDMFEEDRS